MNQLKTGNFVVVSHLNFLFTPWAPQSLPLFPRRSMKRILLLLSLSLLPASAQEKSLSDLALEPPLIHLSPGPEYADAVRPGNMILGMDRTPKGRLWAAWVGNGDSPNGFFLLATSDDDGKTWSPPKVVIDPQDGQQSGVSYERRSLVGNLWTDPLGRLWCFFDQSLGYFDVVGAF